MDEEGKTQCQIFGHHVWWVSYEKFLNSEMGKSQIAVPKEDLSGACKYKRLDDGEAKTQVSRVKADISLW